MTGWQQTQVLRGRVVTRSELIQDGYVALDGARLAAVGHVASHPAPAELPSSVGTLLPGLIDIHCHGGGGAAVTSGDPEQVRTVARHHLVGGTTSLLASTVTDTTDHMLAAIRACATTAEQGAIEGIHLEGPFLAASRCGAQDPQHLRLPDLGLAADLVAAGRGRVRTMTLAPELPGADRLIDLLEELGVMVAVGHTEGSAAVVARALSRSRPALVTHLFNGMPPLHHRAPGPVAASLSAAAKADAWVELVADGVHLADATVAMVFDLLGPDRVVLVTDAMAAAGMPDGDFEVGPRAVQVRDGVARLAGDDARSIAGGTARLLEVVRRCVLTAGIDLVAAVNAASATPAAVLGLRQETGELAAGRRADLLVVDDALRLRGVVRAGRWVA